jgi:hypothetical protein
MFEIAHQSALVPLIALLWFGRGLPRAYWLLGLAFAVSWIGDGVADAMGGSWLMVYLWMPVQFALIVVLFTESALWRVGSVVALFVLSGVSWTFSAPGPDMLVTLVGSIAVVSLVRGPLCVPIYLYFGAGTVAYFMMASLLASPHFMVAWYVYQACRLTAYALFIGLVLQGFRRRKWVPS